MSDMEEVRTEYVQFDELELESGIKLKKLRIAYESYGELNDDKSNAILIFHALSGSAHAAGDNIGEGMKFWSKENDVGWWDSFIGPGKIIDTNKFFVICANTLGGCYGSTGPSSINPESGQEYGGMFPEITIKDMVKFQKKLIDQLNIKKLHSVVGSSMGGMEALEWVITYPDTTKKAVIMGTCARISTLNKIYHFEQITAIESDPNFNNGNYYGKNHPLNGLKLARMIAHKNYIDVINLAQRARKEIVQPDEDFNLYRMKHHIESYMLHQGKKFVKRFDANTYLRITQAIQGFDIEKEYGSLNKAFSKINGYTRFMVVTINSDVCFYPEEQEEIVDALKKNNVPNIHQRVSSDKGHDSFLVEPDKYGFVKVFIED